MIHRVYVEKKKEYATEAAVLLADIRSFLGIEGLTGLRLLNRYDVEGVSDFAGLPGSGAGKAERLSVANLLERCRMEVFSDPVLDIVTDELPEGACAVFITELLPGQFDQRADSAASCIRLLSNGEKPVVRCARVWMLYGTLADGELEKIKRYVINPVESREASSDLPHALSKPHAEPEPVESMEGFCDLDDASLEDYLAEHGLAMNAADLALCRAYFADEGRDPTVTEIRMIDTYWSDHCRHTTFHTAIEHVEFLDPEAQRAYDAYLEARREVGRSGPVTLMDLATINAKLLKARGQLDRLDESGEVNACTVKIDVDVDGKTEPWLLFFKNETHNHPTEIEPFGGASTCLGGAIRDPLSGRAYVYAAMRLSGAGNPLATHDQTLEGKLPQRTLVRSAAAGYSSYGNQIGVPAGRVDEWYHPGFVAKRMEAGAVVGAAPASNVVRSEPVAGDVVLLVGGRTGRDGLGGATGSSKSHSVDSQESGGSEVQRGNAPEERKIQRLFAGGEASRLIKRCNDFGAGGVSVAVGELAGGLFVDLDAVPAKYPGLDGTELAISESQERMAVVVAAADVEKFRALATEENLEATPIARVTDEQRLVMEWRGQRIVDIARSFLDTNGAPRTTSARVDAPEPYGKFTVFSPGHSTDDNSVHDPGHHPGGGTDPAADCGNAHAFADKMQKLVCDLNICSGERISEQFDATTGSGTVLAPLGGVLRRTPSQAMVHKVFDPVRDVKTCSLMAWGYNPYISEKDPFRGAYLAVVESLAKLVAAGGGTEETYLSFQEYFERLGQDPSRWGKPLAALLGAFRAQDDLGIAAIGGKDSMSGTFEDLHVPPTLISFAVTTAPLSHIASPEFKQAGHDVYWVRPAGSESDLPDGNLQKATFKMVSDWMRRGGVHAAMTPGYGGAAEAVFKMAVGNNLGFAYDAGWSLEDVFGYSYGSFLIEADGPPADLPEGVRCDRLGRILEEAELVWEDSRTPLAVLIDAYESVLDPVFPVPDSLDCDLQKAEELLQETFRKPFNPLGVAFGLQTPYAGAGGLQVPAGQAIEQLADLQAIPEELKSGPAGTDRNRSPSVALPSDFTHSGTVPPALNRAAPHMRTDRPTVLIPVFPGTNGEWDAARAARNAGADVDVFVIRDATLSQIAESAEAFAGKLRSAHIVVFAGGASAGDEPDGAGKWIAAFLRRPEVHEAIDAFLAERSGLMLGIGNGFQALVRTGLLPLGEIVEPGAQPLALARNASGRHRSDIVRVRVSSNTSPWLIGTNRADIYHVPVSCAEGRLVCSPELYNQLLDQSQIASHYVDDRGHPTMRFPFNPTGSDFAVEAITSPDGRILGRMGHFERGSDGTWINVPGHYDYKLFRSAVLFFRT
jgi:phosphoribosylformylglycinamidine synthase